MRNARLLTFGECVCPRGGRVQGMCLGCVCVQWGMCQGCVQGVCPGVCVCVCVQGCVSRWWGVSRAVVVSGIVSRGYVRGRGVYLWVCGGRGLPLGPGLSNPWTHTPGHIPTERRQTPPNTVDRQTPVKTLPCPKLRLRAVMLTDFNLVTRSIKSVNSNKMPLL